MTNAADIASALDMVTAEVARAGERVVSGQTVDLSDLPTRMTPICAAIAALPHQEALTFAPAVSGLMSALDRIAGLLQGRRDALRQRLDQLNAMQL